VIKTEHPVIGIERRDARVMRVRMPRDDFEAPVVANAAGYWSGEVGNLAGLDIPVFARRRSKFITTPLSGDRIPLQTRSSSIIMLVSPPVMKAPAS
jgi:sarcosine oxidase subunit beta